MVIDFHSHILPGIDDGSSSVEESVALLQREAEQGIRRIVATPHFYARYDNPERFLEKRSQAERLLRQAMSAQPDMPEIHVGAEVYFFPGISESELLSVLTIDSKRCILLEMPQSPWTESMYREMEGIYIKQGITPIIAHVDRYIGPFRTHGIPERLAELPVVVQANASFFLHRSTRRMALKLLKDDKIHLLGSDCHNLETRIPNLGPALSVIRQHSPQSMIDRIVHYQDEVLGDI